MLLRQDQRTQEMMSQFLQQMMHTMNQGYFPTPGGQDAMSTSEEQQGMYPQTVPRSAVYHDLAFGDDQLPMDSDAWATGDFEFDFQEAIRQHGWTPEEINGAMEEDSSI